MNADPQTKSPHKFAAGVSLTFFVGIVELIIGFITAIIVARFLGPEGKGIFTLALLLPTMIILFLSLGIGPASVYFTASKQYAAREILGNNIIISLFLGIIGVAAGVIIALFMNDYFFPDVPQKYLLFSLILIPIELSISYMTYILLGAQKIREFNLVTLIRYCVDFLLLSLVIVILGAKVAGAISATIVTYIIVSIVAFHWSLRVCDGISLKLNLNYIKGASKYGIQTHFTAILGYFNFRIDYILIGILLSPTDVGIYSISVALAEKLWLLSHSASTILFPRVAAETDEDQKKAFTPMVARVVLLITALGSLVLVSISRWVVPLLFSSSFSSSVAPLQVLLVGIVAFSMARVFMNDIAGRGRPIYNAYVALMSLLINVSLNIFLIPRHGLVGAACASSISYTFSLVGVLFFYCKISGNSWANVLLPKKTDIIIIGRIINESVGFIKRKASFHRGN